MEQEEFIDIREYFKIVKKRLWLVIILPIFIAALAGAYSYLILEKQYEANTTLYVGTNKDSEEKVLEMNDLKFGETIIADYREFIKQRLIANQVINELGLKDKFTVGSLNNLISVNAKNGTRILEIKVKHTDPVLARDIANKIAQVFAKSVVEIMDIENVKIIDVAVTTQNPVSPNPRLNIAIGVVLGFMISLGIIFIIEFLDNTIKTEEDVANHLGLSVLASIPKTTEL